MVLKLTLVIASISILVTLGIKGFLHNQVHSVARWEEKNSLVEVARRKKAEGKSKVVVPGPIVDYAGAGMELAEALKNYSVFIAEPIESKSFPLDSMNIRTWYKFRILETLARRSYIYCNTCPSIPDVPSEMGTPNYDEFFIDTIGGVLNIEGVEVTEQNNSLPLEKGNSYLLFVSLTPSQVAVLGAGPSGVFRLDKNDGLHPIYSKDSPIQSEVQKRFGLKLSQFKSHINR